MSVILVILGVLVIFGDKSLCHMTGTYYFFEPILCKSVDWGEYVIDLGVNGMRGWMVMGVGGEG